MSTTATKMSANTLIDVLVKDRFVQWGGQLSSDWKVVLGEVLAWYINNKEDVKPERALPWRALIASPDYHHAVSVATYARNLLRVPVNRWNAGGDCKHGHFRALVATPLAVTNVDATNLLWIVMHNQDKTVWDHIWRSRKATTMILAVHAELFGQWTDFTHL